MPQIAPMNWILLFIYIIMNITIFATVLHFKINLGCTELTTNQKTVVNSLIWEW